MRKTKIVCTIGPACDSEETLRAMMLAGMNVARLNFSHGTHAEHQVRIDRIKKLRTELGLPIAIMLDTKGPEYRIGTFVNGKIELHSGDTFTFTTEAVANSSNAIRERNNRLNFMIWRSQETNLARLCAIIVRG